MDTVCKIGPRKCCCEKNGYLGKVFSKKERISCITLLRSEGMKPKERSRLRILVGSTYFTLGRYLHWHCRGTKYAATKSNSLFPAIVFQHRTPLLRKLKNVDMWLQHNKVINLKIAIKNIDGIIVQPGETFSYWKLIGKPTAKKGYVEGMILNKGRYETGIGGGLCQLSNLIYWLTLHTPLTVTERYRHGYDVFPDSNRTQPFGSGATCSYNYIDLQLKNETDQPYQLHLQVTDKDLIGQWRAPKNISYKYEVYEKEHSISHEYWGDYVRHNAIYRKVYDTQGEEIADEFITENHAIMMYQPLLENPQGQEGQ